MTRDQLAAAVEHVQEIHAQAADAGSPRPPNDAELAVLHLDKAVATADAYELECEPDDWQPTDTAGRLEATINGRSYVFLADEGLFIHVHQPADLET